MNDKDYWDIEYWKKCLNENKDKKLDFINDSWIEKYRVIFNKIPRGSALDLGCGLGQDTKFLIDEKFHVISADISNNVLLKVKELIPEANTINIDMKEKLPFEDNQFDLVFANLSTHYFNFENTVKLYKEIYRILKNGGYFIGRCNSMRLLEGREYKYKQIEKNFYLFEQKYCRLFNKEQFDIFFKKWNVIILNEEIISRWERKKYLWEFIIKK